MPQFYLGENSVTGSSDGLRCVEVLVTELALEDKLLFVELLADPPAGICWSIGY